MRARHCQRGSVLVLTLWLAAGLAAGALLAGHVEVLRYRREANRRAALSAEHAIDAGRGYVAQILTTLGSAGALPDVADYTAADIPVGECRLWLLGRAAETDGEEPVFALQDEAARLDLNTATLEILLALPGMTPELAGAIVDWRDADDDISPDGAEAETYLAREPPCSAKNAPFETVDELRQLNGAEAILLEGTDRNRNTLIEPWEKELAEQRQERFRDIPDVGLIDLLTVHSREPNKAAAGGTRTRLSELRNVMAVRTALRLGQMGDDQAQRVVSAAGSARSVLHLCLLAGLKDAGATAAFDLLTVTDPAQDIVGRVNLNTASAAILGSLPGIAGADNAARLIAWREQNPDSLQTPLWLVSALGGSEAVLALAAAGDLVTTKSYQVTADIVAVGPAGRAFRRTRFVFDLSKGTPTVVSRRDLTHLGWPLGEALHRELATAPGGNIL
jgi:DNA uptake protein ComE-like DNA-binding protein